jgi:hypothetical protein
MSDASPQTITEHEAAEVARANETGLQPVVFIHGLWLLPSSWANWADLFTQAGYAPLTPDWPDDPETVEAIKVAIATRPQPKDAGAAGLVFITSRGKAWAKDKDDNPISKETAKILKKLGIHRPGLNFYALRHVFQTVGDGSRDGSAVAAIMGHAPSQNDMGATYREHIPDDRLLAVSEHVRRWLWPLKGKRKAR